MKSRFVFLVVACFGLITSAHADPITWNLVNVHFSDGATAGGYIVYDSTRRIVLDFDVHTTDGGVLQAFEYTPVNSSVTPSGSHSALGAFSLGAPTQTRQLFLEVNGTFSSPATLALDVSSYERCYSGPCVAGFRTVEGQLSSTPEPWSLALVGSVMILLPRLRPFVLQSPVARSRRTRSGLVANILS
jgi:hypothetical protein